VAAVVRYIVYALVDPRNNEIRYIGETQNSPKARLRKHLYDALRKTPDGMFDNGHKASWIRELIASGLEPQMEEIQEYKSRAEMNAGERFWIDCMKHLVGCRITNHPEMPGGDGGIVTRKPNCTDEQVIEAYRSGLSSKVIAKKFNTCKKRVLVVLHKAGIEVPPSGKSTIRKIRDDVGNVFSSITEAGAFYGVTMGTISNNLRGRNKRAAGHKFEYIDSEKT
jgi:GIY-YIG catalytic domain